MFQDAGTPGCLATAGADHKDAYKLPPVFDGHMILASVALKGPISGKMRGCISFAKLKGPISGKPSYPEQRLRDIVTTQLQGRLGIPSLGYSGGAGEVAAESVIQGVLAAFTGLNGIFAFEPEMRKETQLDYGGNSLLNGR